MKYYIYDNKVKLYFKEIGYYEEGEWSYDLSIRVRFFNSNIEARNYMFTWLEYKWYKHLEVKSISDAEYIVRIL
jgi:hypothetical protein